MLFYLGESSGKATEVSSLKNPALLYNYFLGKISFPFSASLHKSFQIPLWSFDFGRLMRPWQYCFTLGLLATETLPVLAWMYEYSCCLLPCFSGKAFSTFRDSGNFHYFSQCSPHPFGLRTHTLCCFDVISSKYFATERQRRVTEVLQALTSGFQPSPVNNSSITH